MLLLLLTSTHSNIDSCFCKDLSERTLWQGFLIHISLFNMLWDVHARKIASTAMSVHISALALPAIGTDYLACFNR